MDEHQHERDRREQELADRLKGLADRVANMEQEALGYREHRRNSARKPCSTPHGAAQSCGLVGARRAGGPALAGPRRASADGYSRPDHFKRINDNYGHLAGDKVLKIVADQLRKRLRGQDFIARFGGEEFVVLLPQTSPAVGLKLAETLRAAVEACPFHFKGERVVITTSIGLSAFRSGERGDQVLKRADDALYRAKDQGRNRVEQA